MPAEKTEGRISIVTEIIEDNVQIAITDNGKGISKENLEKLFTPFFTTKEKGTGLGLAIAQKIVDEHDGKIHVESEVGKGTTFYITLPLVKELVAA
jgi:two-component system, sporulation sensor kinase E